MEKSLTGKAGKDELEKRSCWEKRSKKEKRLIMFAVGAALVLIVLIIVLVVYFTGFSSTCLTSSCVKATTEFLKHIRSDINPCDDFYEFACGNFAKNLPQQNDDFPKSIDSLLSEAVDNRLQAIIEEPITADDNRALALTKGLYRACLNQDAIDIHGLVSIQDALKKIGGWPVLEGNAWNEWNFEWKLATYKLREFGYHFQFFIALDVVPDINDPSKAILRFHPPDTPLAGASDEDEELFFDYMVNISVAFGANRALAKHDFQDVIDFQKSLFLNLPEDQKRNKYDPLTISELRHKFSEIPWMEYINRLIYPIQSVSYDQTVTVVNEAYFRRLQNALRRISKRVVANYIAWRTVRQQSIFLTSELSELSWRYYSAMADEQPPTASKKCSDLAGYIFPLPVQAEYVNRFITKHTKHNVAQILNNIKKEFTKVISGLDWIDSETLSKSIERIALTTDYVAYPNALLNVRNIEEYYKGIEVDEHNFFQSMLQANFFQTNLKFQKLHERPSDNYQLDEDYTTSTKIFYSAYDNSITVPSGALQSIVYDSNRPQSLNYGALGTSIGHQVFHIVFEGKGCRNEARYYDWLSTRTLLNFERKLSCVEKHYNEYFLPGLGEHLNSSNTRHEDVADIAGIKLAYNAYKAWISENGVEQRLPNVDYTQHQIFWIAAAHRFCAKETSESLANTIAHSYKSPKRFRLIGAVRNLDEFSRDFGCPSNSYMNNNEKCHIL